MNPTILTTSGRVVGRIGRERRQAFLDALLDQVQAYPWHDVTVIDLAIQAQCSPAAFYQYFTDLYEAFDVLCEQITGRGEQLPPRVEAVARLRAVEKVRKFTSTPAVADPAVVAAYVTRARSVQAVQWTGENEAEVQKLTGTDFYALDEEDRANCDDPEATATLLESEHSTWVLVYTGRWIVREADGALCVLDQHAFEHVYQAAGAGVPDAE